MQRGWHRRKVITLGSIAVSAVLAIGLIVWVAFDSRISPSGQTTKEAGGRASTSASSRGSRTPNCSAKQLVLVGRSLISSAPTPPGAVGVGTLHEMRNRGTSCVFRIPKTVVAINAKGIHRRVNVESTVNRIIPWRSRPEISIGEILPTDVSPPSECRDPIREVTQVAVPIGNGFLDIHVAGSPWAYACKSPATVEVDVGL